MKNRLVTLLSIILVLAAVAALPGKVSAKSNKHKITKSHKAKKSSKKKTKRGKKQSALIKSSLEKLAKYYPEYNQNSTQESSAHYVQNAIYISNQSVFANHIFRERMINNINSWLGTPYSYAGHSKKGVDCSDFVACIFEETFGVKLVGSAATQSNLFKPIEDMDSLKFGDLVFFKGTNMRSKRVGHVAIYIGNGLFAHSSTGRGVIYTLLDEAYYTQRFLFGGRFYKSEWNKYFPATDQFSVQNVPAK